MQPKQLSPDPDSFALAESMVGSDEVMRTIISETIESAKKGAIKEAGRTKCPGSGNVRGPLGRYSRSIDLAGCPVSRGGTWHTHVSPSELRSPVNSLPDMANVVYGLIDVSVVAGTDTADVVVAAEDREAMRAEFENAIGARLSGPREMYQAIKQGRVAPTTARKRARDALSEMVMTADTGYGDLSRQVETVPAANWAAPMMSGRNEAYAGQSAPAFWQSESVDEAASKMDSAIEGWDLTGLVISTTVGTVVGSLVDRVLFDRE